MHKAPMPLQHTRHSTLMHLAKAVGSVCMYSKVQCSESTSGGSAAASQSWRCSRSQNEQQLLKVLQTHRVAATAGKPAEQNKIILAHLLCPVTAQSDLPVSKHISHCLRLTTRPQLAQLLLQRAKRSSRSAIAAMRTSRLCTKLHKYGLMMQDM